MLSHQEIEQIAHLLRVSADAARMVAASEPLAAERLLAIARQSEALSDELDDINVLVVPPGQAGRAIGN